MKKQLTYVAPLRAGIVLAVLYGILALIFVPFFVLGVMIGHRTGSSMPAVFGLGFAILMPIVYAVFGFIGGVLSAALYNVIAKLTGGFEFEVRDLAAAV